MAICTCGTGYLFHPLPPSLRQSTHGLLPTSVKGPHRQDTGTKPTLGGPTRGAVCSDVSDSQLRFLRLLLFLFPPVCEFIGPAVTEHPSSPSVKPNQLLPKITENAPEDEGSG